MEFVFMLYTVYTYLYNNFIFLVENLILHNLAARLF